MAWLDQTRQCERLAVPWLGRRQECVCLKRGQFAWLKAPTHLQVCQPPLIISSLFFFISPYLLNFFLPNSSTHCFSRTVFLHLSIISPALMSSLSLFCPASPCFFSPGRLPHRPSDSLLSFPLCS